MENDGKTPRTLPADAVDGILGGANIDKPPLEIHVDISQLTFGDLEVVAKFQGKSAEEVNMIEVLPLLKRVVKDLSSIRLIYIPEILEAIDKAFAEAGNPKNLTEG